MVEQQVDVFYYVTMMNENYAQPDLVAGSEADIIRGCYKFTSYPPKHSLGQSPKTPKKATQKVTLMGSGAILTEVVKAAEQLAAMDVDVTVFSVTSWSELARDGMAAGGKDAFVTQQLLHSEGPIIAATDYVRAVPDSIRAWLPAGRSYTTLGTDGFGRSDTRAALRDFFGVDAASVVKAALAALAAPKMA